MDQQLYVPASILNELPAMVRNGLAKMSPTQQEEFVEEYRRKAKSVGVAYLFLLIILAMHYGYLGKWGLQIVFWLTCGGFFVWWIIDIFRLPSLVKDYNKDAATDVMRNLKTMSL